MRRQEGILEYSQEAYKINNARHLKTQIIILHLQLHALLYHCFIPSCLFRLIMFQPSFPMVNPLWQQDTKMDIRS